RPTPRWRQPRRQRWAPSPTPRPPLPVRWSRTSCPPSPRRTEPARPPPPTELREPTPAQRLPRAAAQTTRCRVRGFGVSSHVLPCELTPRPLTHGGWRTPRRPPAHTRPLSLPFCDVSDLLRSAFAAI